MGGLPEGGGRKNEKKKNEKRVLPQAVCNQFDSSVPDQSATLGPSKVKIIAEIKVLFFLSPQSYPFTFRFSNLLLDLSLVCILTTRGPSRQNKSYYSNLVFLFYLLCQVLRSIFHHIR